METKTSPTKPKTLEQIGREWDAAAGIRHRQISSGADLSFSNVLMPAALGLLDGGSREVVLDIGCGTGELTREISLRASRVTAVDLSPVSISIAESVCSDRKNVTFVVGALDALTKPPYFFSDAIAAMTLMTMPDIDMFAARLSELLQPGGTFTATITHPWFWPKYWGYESAAWFDYKKEIFIEAPFHISLDYSSVITTHIHRPLEKYVSSFSHADFWLETALELKPSLHIEALYPEPWGYPRFLALRWRKRR